MLKLKLLKMTLLAVVLSGTAFLVLLPGLARAQEPQDMSEWTIHHWSELLNLDQGPSQGALCATGDPVMGSYDAINDRLVSATPTRVGDCSWLLGAFEALSPDVIVSPGGQIQFTIEGDPGQGPGYNAQWHVYSFNGTWSNSSGNYGQGTHTVNIPEGSTKIAITYWAPFFAIGPVPYISSINFINIEPEIEIGETCATIEDAHFTGVITDAWLLEGSAVITDSVLTLGPGDVAAQNLTLESLTTYNAVISTTDMILPSTLVVRLLGTVSETLEITGTGRFTASFTTPNLSGPIAYILENTGSNAINVDFTCLYPDYGDGQVTGCLAPLNGTFEDDSHWNWYRGAAWFYPGKTASLPVADAGLIGSTETYTMPTITGTERLLLGFTARGLGDDGVISGQVTNGTSTAEFNFSTYRAEYSYETNLSSLAEENNLQFSFVNPSDVITGIVSSADVVVDNICVFVANRGPNLPTPTDPGGITPVDPGLGFSSCGQLDGIWAFFGVNMAQYRATYAAGTSVWDPIGWVPWLISAIFVVLANWACFFYAAYLNLIDLITYFLNSVMNIGNWLVRIFPLLVAWLSLWLYWARNSLLNFAGIFGTLAAWLLWIGQAGWAFYTALGLTAVAAVAWLLTSWGNLITAVFPWLYSWLSWLALSLGNLAAWLLANLLSMNGLRLIANWLIGGWNDFLLVLGSVLSLVLADLVGIWNDSLVPFLADVWAWVAGMPATIVALLIDFVLAAWDLLYTMFLWLWENVISIAATPLTFYNAFNEGVNADPYNLVSCVGENFWCTFLAGVQMVNQLIAHSTLYPIIIVGIILSTLWILWDNFLALFQPIEIR